MATTATKTAKAKKKQPKEITLTLREIEGQGPCQEEYAVFLRALRN